MTKSKSKSDPRWFLWRCANPIDKCSHELNRATCERCKHTGKAGDWERLEVAYATIRDLEAKLRGKS